MAVSAKGSGSHSNTAFGITAEFNAKANLAPGLGEASTQLMEWLRKMKAGINDFVISVGKNLFNILRKDLVTALTMAATTTATIVVAGTAGVLGIFTYASGAWRRMERDFARVFTLLPEQMRGANTQILNDSRALARQYGISVREIANATYEAISSGVQTASLGQFMQVAGKAAIGGSTSLVSSVQAITTVMRGYNLEVKEATKISDIFFKAEAAGKTTVEELSRTISNVTANASQLGVSFKHVAASVSTITTAGVKTTQAVIWLNSAFRELLKETSKAGENFQRIAGESFAEFIAAGGSVREAFTLMAQDAEQSGKAIVTMFESGEAANAAYIISAAHNKDTYESIVNDYAGSTEKAAKRIQDTWEYQKQRLAATWADIKVSIGRVIVPLIQAVLKFVVPIVNKAADVIEWVTDQFEKLPTGVRIAAVAILGLGAVFGTTIFTVMFFLAQVVGIQAALFALKMPFRVATNSTNLYTASLTGATLAGKGFLGTITQIPQKLKKVEAATSRMTQILREIPALVLASMVVYTGYTLMMKKIRDAKKAAEDRARRFREALDELGHEMVDLGEDTKSLTKRIELLFQEVDDGADPLTLFATGLKAIADNEKEAALATEMMRTLSEDLQRQIWELDGTWAESLKDWRGGWLQRRDEQNRAVQSMKSNFEELPPAIQNWLDHERALWEQGHLSNDQFKERIKLMYEFGYAQQDTIAQIEAEALASFQTYQNTARLAGVSEQYNEILDKINRRIITAVQGKKLLEEVLKKEAQAVEAANAAHERASKAVDAHTHSLDRLNKMMLENIRVTIKQNQRQRRLDAWQRGEHDYGTPHLWGAPLPSPSDIAAQQYINKKERESYWSSPVQSSGSSFRVTQYMREDLTYRNRVYRSNRERLAGLEERKRVLQRRIRDSGGSSTQDGWKWHSELMQVEVQITRTKEAIANEADGTGFVVTPEMREDLTYHNQYYATNQDRLSGLKGRRETLVKRMEAAGGRETEAGWRIYESIVTLDSQIDNLLRTIADDERRAREDAERERESAEEDARREQERVAEERRRAEELARDLRTSPQEMEDHLYQLGELSAEAYRQILHDRFLAAGGRTTDEGRRIELALQGVIEAIERQTEELIEDNRRIVLEYDPASQHEFLRTGEGLGLRDLTETQLETVY